MGSYKMKYILRKEVSTVKLEDWDADYYLVATCILNSIKKSIAKQVVSFFGIEDVGHASWNSLT